MSHQFQDLILCPNLLLGTCCWTHIVGGASHLGASNCSHQHSPHTSIADDELETIRGGANSFCHSDLPTFPLAGYPPTKSKRGGNGHIHCLSLIFPAINLHFSRGFSSPRLITRGYFSWSGWVSPAANPDFSTEAELSQCRSWKKALEVLTGREVAGDRIKMWYLSLSIQM